MILIVGGQGQGKLAYAKTIAQKQAAAEHPVQIIDRLHLRIKECMAQGKVSEQKILQKLGIADHSIVICDEVGMGVTPADPFEREWREMTGRICCHLAKKAETVFRIIAGCAVKLK